VDIESEEKIEKREERTVQGKSGVICRFGCGHFSLFAVRFSLFNDGTTFAVLFLAAFWILRLRAG